LDKEADSGRLIIWGTAVFCLLLTLRGRELAATIANGDGGFLTGLICLCGADAFSPRGIRRIGHASVTSFLTFKETISENFTLKTALRRVTTDVTVLDYVDEVEHVPGSIYEGVRTSIGEGRNHYGKEVGK
jgi:hypothetical protein